MWRELQLWHVFENGMGKKLQLSHMSFQSLATHPLL